LIISPDNEKRKKGKTHWAELSGELE